MTLLIQSKMIFHPFFIYVFNLMLYRIVNYREPYYDFMWSGLLTWFNIMGGIRDVFQKYLTESRTKSFRRL